MTQVTYAQAYRAMFHFLEMHYERTGSADIGALLGDLSQLDDGNPADPAVSEDWQAAIDAAASGQVTTDFRLAQSQRLKTGKALSQ